ncbi:MAG: GNAT family N-acetyltransferase [Candidatus Eiseniibacteriota bacterium]
MAETHPVMAVRPLTLEGEHVRLEPLTMAHHAALWEIAKDHELWRWTATDVRTPGDLARYMENALAEQAAGRALPFATIAKASGHAVGSTRFGNIEPLNRRAEIGWTWLGGRWRRTAVNTEAKLLMLKHVFETWGCIRVELKTDALNQASRAAIARLGAKEEGIFRRHIITQTGRVRDTVYYSILEEEWPSIKARLEARLHRPSDRAVTA